MTVLQKLAWLNLAVLGLVLLALAALVPLKGLSTAFHYLVISPAAFAALWIMVLLGYAASRGLGRLRNRPEVLWDEREDSIYYKACAWAFAASWIFIVLGNGRFLQQYLEKGPEAVSVVLLSDVLGIAFLVLVGMFSVSVLIFSGKESRDAGK